MNDAFRTGAISCGETCVRIFVIDRDPVFRAGIRAMIDGSLDVDLVGESASVKAVVPDLERLAAAVDVFVMDLPFGGTPGAADLKSGVSLAPIAARTKVLVLASTDEDATVIAALRAGARGYLVKGTSQHHILRGVCVVAEGGAVFGPGIAERLGPFFNSVHSKISGTAFPLLTERERQVLDLLARGYHNRRIARALVLSEKTVRNHVSRLLAKLQVSDRTEAALRARDAGLGC